MENEYASRIRARLRATGKSAAAASVEAGLGRSSIQNILAGASESPKVSTLRKLAPVLDCSFEYLVGLVDDPHDVVDFRASEDRKTFTGTISSVRPLEAGVFRRAPNFIEYADERAYAYQESRYDSDTVMLFVMSDDSMAAAGFYREDIVCVPHFDADQDIPFVTGSFLVIEQLINEGDLFEMSLREVSVGGGKVHLSTRPVDGEPDVISFDPEERDSRFTLSNVYGVSPSPTIQIVGPASRLIRRLPAFPAMD